MRTWRREHRWLVAGAALLVGVACGGPTSPQQSEIARHRARWAAHGLSTYQYDYLATGFFISYAGQRIRLVVRDGAVASATLLSTGQPLPGPTSQWPTVERLFDQAAQAAAAGSLRGVRFDSALDYVSELDLAGPPDASGTLYATALVAIAEQW